MHGGATWRICVHYCTTLIVLAAISCCKGSGDDEGACVDKENVSFELQVDVQGTTKQYTCDELWQAWPFMCHPGVEGGAAMKCCASCSKAGNSIHCADKNMVFTYALMNNLKVMCHDFTTYPEMCFSKSIQEACCKTCTEVDVENRDVDNPFKFWYLNGNKKRQYYCADMIREEKCFCAMYKIRTSCRKSCKGVNTDVPECTHFQDSAEVEEVPDESEEDKKFCPKYEEWLYLPDGGELQCQDLRRDDYKCYCMFFRSTCCKTCENYVGDQRDCRLWEFSVKRYPDEILHNCRTLIARYPWYCRDKRFSARGGLCSQTCAKPANIERAKCTFDPEQVFRLGGREFYCDQLVGFFGCACDYPIVMEFCCEDCSHVDLDKCGCKNMEDFQQQEVMMVQEEPFYECAELVEKKPAVCRERSYNKRKGGWCCEACRGRDLSCVDELEKIPDPEDPSVQDYCHNLAPKRPYHCQQGHLKEICCLECEQINAECLNTPGRLSIPGLPPWVKSNMNCNELAQLAPQLCMEDPPDTDIRTYKWDCCRSCQNADLECYDTFEQLPDPLDASKLYDCDSLTELRPYYCTQANHDIAKKCCSSCKQRLEVCHDTEGSFEIPELHRDPVASMTCQEMVEYFPQLCLDNPQPSPFLVSYKSKCCLLCSIADTTLVDDPYFRLTSCFVGRNVRCDNCYCNNLRQTKSNKELRNACSRIPQVLQKCYKTCSAKGFHNRWKMSNQQIRRDLAPTAGIDAFCCNEAEPSMNLPQATVDRLDKECSSRELQDDPDFTVVVCWESHKPRCTNCHCHVLATDFNTLRKACSKIDGVMEKCARSCDDPTIIKSFNKGKSRKRREKSPSIGVDSDCG